MKNIFSKRFLLGILLLQYAFVANGQVLTQIKQSFDQYQLQNFQEKLFVQTDKEFYVTGEILWFKLYYVDARTNKPANLSKLAYVELLDKNNNPLLQAKIALENGTGNGSLYIPINALNGAYKLRAYTNWMQNFGPDVFFEKQINLVNTLNTPEVNKEAKQGIDLQFFPEGGDMVAGITTKVAFKALNTDGNGADIHGVIINQRNDTVGRFQTQKFGMGQFSFKPQANQTYKAIASANNGEILIKELPQVKPKGYALNLVEEDDDLLVSVNSNINSDPVYLVVYNNQGISFAQDGGTGNAKFKINKSKLPAGISYLTAFNVLKQPVCERLYFKTPNRKFDINATLESNTYSSRKNVIVNIASNNNGGANLSVSVRKLDALQNIDQADIVSYFWLGSVLKGNIESPSFYFSDQPEVKHALENLLLTQGWRKFNWDKILNNNNHILKFLPEYNGHLINGLITDQLDKPVKEIIAYMGVPSKRIQFYGGISDFTGHFKFNTKDFYGTNEIILQTNYERDSLFKVTLLSPFAENYSPFNYLASTIKSSLIPELKAYSLGMQVNNIYAGNKLKQFYDPEVDSTSFYRNPYKIYMLNDYTRFTTMEEVFREYIAQVFVNKKQKRFHLHFLNETGFAEVDPLVLVDGVPYFNIDRVMAIDPLKVEKIEVFRNIFFSGPTSSEGIVSISTFKNNLSGVEIDPHAVVIDYEGMQLQREFYVPKYESDAQKQSRLPDFRNVLYWSPNLPLSVDGKGQINFYTSDLTGNYIGIIQGITNNGIPGSGYFKFEVKK